MGDKEASEKKSGLFKTIIGAAAGLFSGAVMMYASPILDKVIKPAKPVANFGFESNSLAVTFHNRSSGGHEGWWDFGDGSPLEPVDLKQEFVTHTYPRPADYTAKLSLRNLIGDENERMVTVSIDPTKAVAPPSVEAIEVTPLSSESYAPATFRVTCRVKNAPLCIWSLGDDQPFQITNDGSPVQDRLVTFNKAGGYIIKVAAVNGKQVKEGSEIVCVNEPPKGTIAAIMNVSEQATLVESIKVPFVFEETWPAAVKDKSYNFDRRAPSRPGFEVVDVLMPTVKNGQPTGLQGNRVVAVDGTLAGRGVKELRVQLEAEHHSVRLTGTMVKESSVLDKSPAAPKMVFPVTLVQERRSPTTRPNIPVTGSLQVPGVTTLSMPPLPPDWRDTRRQARLELRDGDRVLWQDSQLPKNAPVTIMNRRCLLTATQLGEQVRVELVEVKTGLRPTAN